MQKYILKNSSAKSIIFKWFKDSMASYATGSQFNWKDEDSLCAQFLQSISGWITTPSGDLNINSYKIRGRGPGAEEKKLGADGIALVEIHTPNTKLSGFFLFQAKKATDKKTALTGASIECHKMLEHTAASYLLVLLPDEVKMVGAMAVKSHTLKTNPSLNDIPYLGFPRFIVEHLLQGVMMEPFVKGKDLFSTELKKEIKHIISVVGGVGENIENAKQKVDSYLKEFEIEKEEPPIIKRED